MLNKDFLRKKYLNSRKKLTKKFVQEKSSKIIQKLLSLDQLREARVIAAYLPINNEVGTKAIINRLSSRKIKILLPCYLKDQHRYVFGEFLGWQDLEEGPYGILQPSPPVRLRSPKDDEGSVIDSSKVEVAIIPGVAFDRRGMRLGYGKGVYDRLLSKSNALKIGLSYDFQVLEKLPKEKHDLEIDILVTEARILRSTKTS